MQVMGDAFIRAYIEDLLKNIRTQVLLKVVPVQLNPNPVLNPNPQSSPSSLRHKQDAHTISFHNVPKTDATDFAGGQVQASSFLPSISPEPE